MSFLALLKYAHDGLNFASPRLRQPLQQLYKLGTIAEGEFQDLEAVVTTTTIVTRDGKQNKVGAIRVMTTMPIKIFWRAAWRGPVIVTRYVCEIGDGRLQMSLRSGGRSTKIFGVITVGDITMTVDRIIEIENWVNDLRGKHSLNVVIDAVQKRKDAEKNERSKYQLALILKGLLIEAGRDQEALHLLKEMAGRLPGDVRFPIAEASLNLYFLDNPKAALTAIDEALARARRTGLFRREALGVKARILLKLGLGEELAATLEEIMNLKIEDGVPDVGRERDFIDQMPSGLISEELRARYDAFCPKIRKS